MPIPFKVKAHLVFIALILFLFCQSVSSAPPRIPKPLLFLTGFETFQQGEQNFIRYRFDVSNKYLYPPPMFAAAPNLPPCGTNANASRTWVDIYDESGKRLNGFCAFSWAGELSQLWFEMKEDTIPPSWVYIELTDRQTNTKYKSNRAGTTL